MENLDLLDHDLQVSPATQNFLSEAARWGKFLSIIGFIFCLLLALASLFVPTIYSRLSTLQSLPPGTIHAAMTSISVIYIILAIILFFPSVFLLRFSARMKTALNSVNQENFDEAFKNLKSLFKFYGIFTIIILSFYVLIFIISMLGLAMR